MKIDISKEKDQMLDLMYQCSSDTAAQTIEFYDIRYPKFKFEFIIKISPKQIDNIEKLETENHEE